MKELRSPRILHLATHGFFLRDQPRLRDGSVRRRSRAGCPARRRRTRCCVRACCWPASTPGSAAATPRPEAEDGLLTAEDVSGMDLLAHRVGGAVACETGLGEVRVGEGVFGLRRAFVLAGAKTLVMSLWKVPDEPTQELMDDFYARLLAGEPRAEALRQAQLALKARHPHPYYWGAFICQGEPFPLPQ